MFLASSQFPFAVERNDDGDTIHNSARLFMIESCVKPIVKSTLASSRPSTLSTPVGVLLGEAREKWSGGMAADAEAICRRALDIEPANPEALVVLSEIMTTLGRPAEAAVVLNALVAASPDDAAHLRRLGTALLASSEFDAAITTLRKAISIDPRNSRGHNNLGQALFGRGNLQEAADCYGSAIACDPGHAGAHNNLGRALHLLGRLDESAWHFAAAIRLAPTSTVSYLNLGALLASQEKNAMAAQCYDQALRIDPRSAEAWLARANFERCSGRLQEALRCVYQLLELRPDHVQAIVICGQLLRMTNNPTEARKCFENAASKAPHDPVPLHELAMLLGSEGDLNGARACLTQLQMIAPNHPYLHGYRLYLNLSFADWDEFTLQLDEIERGVNRGDRVCSPYQAALVLKAPDQQKKCIQNYVDAFFPAPETSRWIASTHSPRPRIGYLSADFHDHATAHLMAGVFEMHDRERFDIVALSIGRPTGDAMYQRLERAFGKIEQLGQFSDWQCASFIKDHAIDILVDLKGHTLHGRPGILQRRPAPIQVNYLGFPGTMGASYIDYLIADAHVIPPADSLHYLESIAYLPCCYQANDRSQLIDPKVPSRGECGLPENAFVYCCFNGIHKFTPQVFDVWMRVLDRVHDSVLWLLESNPSATSNLRKHALRNGIDTERLVFAKPVPHAQHLARYRIADLFLDTTPYNAHTTGSDAMFVGCPLLTVRGKTFAGRVCGSLLRAAGMSELETQTILEYEEKAVEIGSDASLHAELRQRFSVLRHEGPVFDTARITRELESAFQTMWLRHQEGLRPASFDVPFASTPIPPTMR